ncbi:MAG: hypothetical protein JWS12_827 [Candidatus Saccharibacteria bacterium]|nr:hypothetical protein [Candidatus Saccharibacteria bacterium]
MLAADDATIDDAADNETVYDDREPNDATTNSGRLRSALEKTPREAFVPAELRSQAWLDAPLPIGFGQTISQPTTVRLMLEWLDVGLGQAVLDVGSGSGWTSALLSRLVGNDGHVYAVELVPELLRLGKSQSNKLKLTNLTFHQAGDTLGLPTKAPFDRILVSAAASQIPSELVDQLATGGKMVIPVRDAILVISKSEKGEITQQRYPGFIFVPLMQ